MEYSKTSSSETTSKDGTTDQPEMTGKDDANNDEHLVTSKEEQADADAKSEKEAPPQEEGDTKDAGGADCFTASGIFITPQGPKRADEIVAGDRIMTMTNGFRAVRYIMHRPVHALGPKAPITFAPGVLNNTVEFECSRKHRLYSGAITEFKGKNRDHLLCAYEMLNGTTVTCRRDGRAVDYYHFLLDQHDLVVCSGVISESWVPSKQYMDATHTTHDIFASFSHRAAALDALEGPWVRETISFDPINIRRAAQHRG